jgi:predicted esterase
MIMVHGRNASPQSILELCPVLDRPTFTYLAPAAAGNTWYPYSFMAETASNEPYLTSALSVLEHLVGDVVAAGIPHDRIMLLGFSQGACLTGEFSVRNAVRYGGVIMYSGGLIGPPGTTWNGGGSFDETPVFLGCSDVDNHVPETRVHESASVFRRMGADVTDRIYPGMAHTVNADEIRFTQALMDQVLAAQAQ